MTYIQDNIIEKLFEGNYITAEQKQQIVQRLAGGEHFENVLAEISNIDDQDLLSIKADVMEVPYISLDGVEIEDTVLHIIPVQIAKNNRLIAFGKEGNHLKVGMVDPYNIQAVETVDFLTKQENLVVDTYLISDKDYQRGMKGYATLGREVATALKQRKELEESVADAGDVSAEQIKSAPISKIVSVIIRHAVEAHASDIHIEPEEDEVRVRYRVDGVLQTSLTLPIHLHASLIARIKVLAKLKLDETRTPQDGRIKLDIGGRTIDLRISILPLLGKEKATLRILDTGSVIYSIEELGFRGRAQKIIEENIKKPYGLILVTGPTGSGKTTTLYTLMNYINDEEVNITTLEDPIEYRMEDINQSQVNPQIGYTFATGLRSLLRQDPDVIMVGEIRDNETAELAIHAGLTGHLLFSTLHTNNAFGAIPRLVDMGIERFLLASTLNIIIAQRLVRKICQDCKYEVDVASDLMIKIKSVLEGIGKEDMPDSISLDEIKLYEGKGCNKCGNIGYKGRTAIAEVLEVTEDLKRIINDGADFEEINAEAIRQKMISMQQDGFIKALEGVTTISEVLRQTGTVI